MILFLSILLFVFVMSTIYFMIENIELKEENRMIEVYQKSADQNWVYYCKASADSRRSYQEKEMLEELLAHKEIELDNANQWATGFESAYIRVSSENQTLKERIDSLEKLAQHEFEWSMEYSASAEKYASLYDLALKDAVRLEG